MVAMKKAAPKPSVMTATGANIVMTVDASSSSSSAVPGSKPKPPKPCDKTDPKTPYGFKIESYTMPESDKAYQVQFNVGTFSASKSKIKITKSGLLSNVSSTATGNFYEVFAKSDGASPSPAAAKPAVPSFKIACPVKTILESKMDCLDLRGDFTSKVSGQLELKISDVSNVKLKLNSLDSCEDGKKYGLCYRSRLDVFLTISLGTGANSTKKQKIVPISIIDPFKTFVASPIRRPFVESKTELVFDNGVLISVDGEYPSPATTILAAPFNAIGTALGDVVLQGSVD